MLVSCKCLNVTINLGKARPKDVVLASLRLSRFDRDHSFFTKGVAEVEEIPTITKQIPALTVSEESGNWIIETCLNCSLPYYAQHKDKLIPALLSTEVVQANEMEMLKNSPDYSLAFSMVINSNFENKSASLCKKTVQMALSALQHQLADAIRKEADRTDERIRIYTDQQYDLLTQYRKRAQLDHETLICLLQDAEVAEEAVEIPIGTSKPLPSPTNSTRYHQGKSHGFAASPAVGIRGRKAGRSNSLFSPNTEVAASYDAEGVFNLEGMDDSPSDLVASEGDSDTDHDDSGSHDEGIDIHRQKGNPSNIARSLPVNVPVFPNRLQQEAVEINYDQYEEINQTDIAASIKALARSVHQDVFGELPRPRFSTQI